MEVHLKIEFDTPLSPDRVLEALTDFSETRPETWPTLDPQKYRVCELGATTALVREGNRRPDIWAEERYDWSTPGTVSWSTEASNAFVPGSRIEVVVATDGKGGSHVTMDSRRVAATPIGRIVVLALKLFGRRFLLSTYKANFDRIAAGG